MFAFSTSMFFVGENRNKWCQNFQTQRSRGRSASVDKTWNEFVELNMASGSGDDDSSYDFILIWWYWEVVCLFVLKSCEVFGCDAEKLEWMTLKVHTLRFVSYLFGFFKAERRNHRPGCTSGQIHWLAWLLFRFEALCFLFAALARPFLVFPFLPFGFERICDARSRCNSNFIMILVSKVWAWLGSTFTFVCFQFCANSVWLNESDCQFHAFSWFFLSDQLSHIDFDSKCAHKCSKVSPSCLSTFWLDWVPIVSFLI